MKTERSTRKRPNRPRTELDRHEHAVIPGFYGALPNGTINTFSRGGQRYYRFHCRESGDADMYENWTDVSGFLMADPRVVDDSLHHRDHHLS